MSGFLATVLVCALAGTDVSVRERELFDQRIVPLLKRSAWDDSLAYSSGHYLMVPLHTAFAFGEREWVEGYRAHMEELVKQPKERLVKNPLSRMQYLYVPSQYLVLRSKERFGEEEKRLRDYLTQLVVSRWRDEEAIAYDSRPFRGVEARLQHKLGLRNPRTAHFQAIIDEEFFLFAIACDLVRVDELSGQKNPRERDLREIRDMALKVLRQFGVNQRDGGWLFQPGAWKDHPDHAYSNHTEVRRGLSKSVRANLAWDTSHFHRFGRLVLSYRDAFSTESSEWRYLEDVRKRHSRQFVTKVLVKPGSGFAGYRTANYMDGWNGVYRYGRSEAIGLENGYGAYQLSGTYLLGWWGFLGNREVQRSYETMAGQFPLPESALQVYLGPVYKPKEQRTAVSWYENGMGELFVRLAAKLPADH